MKNFVAFLLFAFTLNMALGLNLRYKRQSTDNIDDNVLDNLGDDRWIWGEEEQPRPNQGGTQGQQPSQVGNLIKPTTSTTRAPVSNQITTQSPRIQECIRNCPVTPEYNPVCGTDLAQYSNIGRLECARLCGVNVTLLRANRCPPTTTTAPPSR